MSKLSAILCALALTLACHKSVHAQVSVAPSPVPEIQFFDANGNPLSGGRIRTFLAGTTTPEATYTDASGTSQNPVVIILDAAGFPANGTQRTGIWLANKSYKFVVQNSSGVTQWTADNVTGYLGLLNLSNTWTFSQIFSLPITVLPSDSQIILGAPGSQTIFDAPPSSGGLVTLHFQTGASDTVVNQNTPDDLKNKTLETPVLNSPTENTPIVNGTQVLNGPGTYVSIPNDTVTGTTLGTLAKLTNSNPAQAILFTTGTSGAIGVVVAGAGKTGNALIQVSGTGACLFDGNTTAGDYVQISQGVAGRCHDTGAATFPNSGGQVKGRVQSTTAFGAGPPTVPLILFDSEIQPPAIFPQVVVSSGTSITNGSVPSTPLATPTTNASYRLNVYAVEASAGTGCSTNSTLTISASYTDALSSTPSTFHLTNMFTSTDTITIVNNGTANSPIGWMVPIMFTPKSGAAISFLSSYSPGTCTAAPFYKIVYVLEILG